MSLKSHYLTTIAKIRIIFIHQQQLKIQKLVGNTIQRINENVKNLLIQNMKFYH